MDKPQAQEAALATQHADGRLLDLDTFINRPKIAIDGTLYEILSPHELSVVDEHRFKRWGARIDELVQTDGDAAEAELDALIAKAARRIIIDVPDDVFAKMSGALRWQVIDLFTALLLRTKLQVAGAMNEALGDPAQLLRVKGSIGAAQSRVSSGSMAETRQTGWIASLSRWFGLT